MLTDTEKYKGYTIEIHTDEHAENPREMFDHFGKMVCWHSRYNLGDKHSYHNVRSFFESLAMELTDNKGNAILSDNQYNNIEDMEDKKLSDLVNKHIIILPLYLYDHSGITMSTGAFSCPWDSGQVGFIYATKEDIRKEYKVKSVNPKLKNQIFEMLKGEVEEYDNYLTGNIYYYNVLNLEKEHIDGCGGFNGYNHEKNGLMEYAKNAIDCEINSKKKKHFKKLKAWIRNRVPFAKRIPCPVI